MADDEEEMGEEDNPNNLGVKSTIFLTFEKFLIFFFLRISLMKVIEMKRMNDMVLVKLNYPMVIRMKVNIRMENDTEQERIDFRIMHVMSVSRSF